MGTAVQIVAERASEKRNVNPDAPWLLRFNPIFKRFGWQLWWRYEYVSSVLVKSETQWMRESLRRDKGERHD